MAWSRDLKSAKGYEHVEWTFDALNGVDVKTANGKVTVGVRVNGEWYVGVEGSNYNIEDVKKLIENKDIETISQMFTKQ
jgi:predicted GNAT superfamily acetyltransferase